MYFEGDVHGQKDFQIPQKNTLEISEMKKFIAGLALTAFASVGAQAHVATIDGVYDLDTYDTPELIFHNTSAYAFTNVNITLTGYQGLNNGVVQSFGWTDMAAGADSNVIWGTGGPLFAYDYDDSRGGGGPCPVNPVNAGLCNDVGNFYVTFTAIWNGQAIYSQFSPTTNATGGFVGWEGLNPDGLSEDPTYDVHNGTLNGTLAYIDVGTPPPLPEPDMLALMAGCMGALALARRYAAKR